MLLTIHQKTKAMNNRNLFIGIALVCGIFTQIAIGQKNKAMDQLIQNAISAQSMMNPTPQKFNQAQSLEKAGLVDQALNLYIDLNEENPGKSKYFKPLRSILVQKGDGLLIEKHSLSYLEANPADVYGKVDLGEIYLLWDKPEKWKTIFNDILQTKPVNENSIKMTVNRLISNGYNEEGYQYLTDFRSMTNDPYFYSLEIASYHSIRFAYKDAMKEYLNYIEGHPKKYTTVSERILSFPNDESIRDIILESLIESELPEAKYILADVNLMSRNYRDSYRLLIDYNANEKMLLDFGTDLLLVGEFDLADSVLNNIMLTSNDEGILEETIFTIAQVYETRTVQSLYLLPISGFFRGNPIFSSPYLRVDEAQALAMHRAVTIYDSLKTATNSLEATFRLGEIKFRALNDLDGAFLHYSELLDFKGSHPYRLDSFLRKMDIYISRGNLHQAEVEIRNILHDSKKLKTPDKNETTELKMKLAQVYFYSDSPADLDSLISDLLANVKPDDDKLNDILELASITTTLKNSPELLHELSEIQLKIQQGKRTEAIKSLERLSADESIVIIGMVRYQLAHLLLLQDEVASAQEMVLTIPEESPYAVLGLIMWSEIEDRINQNISNAIDGYLKFLENYPNSIYYDDIRLRLRKLAS